MEYGIALASDVDAWKTVKRAEELGFTHAWFYDSQLLLPDIFVPMALAAEHTPKITLGTGVLIPPVEMEQVDRVRLHGGASPQYSSGSNSVVTLRSASVMSHKHS